MSRAQLAQLIDLPDEALQQVLNYALTLSKADAVDHFKNLLGDSPAAMTFIADFNGRRHDPAGPSAAAAVAAAASAARGPAPAPHGTDTDAVPKHVRGPKKKKAPLHMPAPRTVDQTAPLPGAAYNKKDMQDDYITSRPSASSPAPPVAPKQQQQQQPTKKPPSAAGSMIQDVLNPKAKSKKSGSKPMAKVTITGGTAMQGASAVLADFDAAIRALEISTNPTLAGGNGGGSGETTDVAARRCNCVATRHPLQTAAPNCLHCGKVICVKEGLGPCTFCGQALLTTEQVQAMIRELREERGREKMAVDRAAHRRPEVAGGGRGGFTKPTMIAGTVKWGGDDADFVSLAEAQANANAHRDRLLTYQSQNAQRTTVRDEAADFDVGEALAVAAAAGDADSVAAQNLWATPEERARALRRQQKLLREMEWNARPEYEKRRQVISIDLAGRKVFKKTMPVDRPPTPSSESESDDGWDGSVSVDVSAGGAGEGGTGKYSKNPLLGGLIRPVYEPQGKGKGKDQGTDEALPGRKDDKAAVSMWRRVQDDLDDNEAIILDGNLSGTAGDNKLQRK